MFKKKEYDSNFGLDGILALYSKFIKSCKLCISYINLITIVKMISKVDGL